MKILLTFVISQMCFCTVLILPAFPQTNGNQISRSGTPTGTRNPGFFRDREPRFSHDVLGRTSSLLNMSGTELMSEYAKDGEVCTLNPINYVALRLAERDYGFDRDKALRSMCNAKTDSFAPVLRQYTAATRAVGLSVAESKTRESTYLSAVTERLKSSNSDRH